MISLRAHELFAINSQVRAYLVCAALLMLCALFMFVDPRTPPIIIWDESRLAVNALEMHQRGWSLVTTYGFAPDLWNSKPPLMIWLMNASISIFGASELALRIPSMVASLGTLLIVFAFVRRVTHSIGTAALAMVLLTASAAFYGEHGARTADYDALLCFFTTAYLSVLYFAVHQPVPSRKQIFAAGALIAGATLTKTIAGLLPGAGVALYLLVSGRYRRAFATRHYVLMMLGALAPLAVFYAAREWIAPGYLKAVWFNDFAGRYEDQLGLNAKPWPFFFQALFFSGTFSGGPLALFAPLGLIRTNGQARQALLYAVCCVAAQLLLISIPATRLIQYALPALPWLAIACAIAAGEQIRRIFTRQEFRDSLPAKLALTLSLAGLAVTSIGLPTARVRYDLLPKRAFYPRASYGALLASLDDRGVRRVSLIEPGIIVGSLKGYAPQLRYYSLLWNERGMTIDRIVQPMRFPRNSLVASCDPRWSRAIIATGGAAIGVDGCAWKTVGGREQQLVQRRWSEAPQFQRARAPTGALLRG